MELTKTSEKKQSIEELLNQEPRKIYDFFDQLNIDDALHLLESIQKQVPNSRHSSSIYKNLLSHLLNKPNGLLKLYEEEEEEGESIIDFGDISIEKLRKCSKKIEQAPQIEEERNQTSRTIEMLILNTNQLESMIGQVNGTYFSTLSEGEKKAFIAFEETAGDLVKAIENT